MKTGYDQFFKKAQKVAAEKKTAPPRRDFTAKDNKLLIEELRRRVQPKKTKRKRRPISWKMAGISILGLIVTVLGLWKIDDIEKLSQRVEISLLGSAYAEDVKAPAQTSPQATAPGETEKKPAAETKRDYSPDEINHFSNLNERKKELDAREEELNKVDQELQVQRAELEKKIKELEETRRGISSVLQEKVKTDDKKIDNLVQIYSSMKAQQAAKAFEEMDEDLAIEILGRMKKKSAAEIMNLVKSEKVKIFSEKYAGYKRN